MANAPLSPVLRHIRKLVATQQGKERTDVQLLHEFAAQNDQAAFAVLVRRHGPMVLGVCRNVLRHTQDAEDAFQATFLVLARKAATIHKAEALVGWLHGVAYRMAMNAKRTAARRRNHESKVKTPSQGDPVWETAWHEVLALLDEEIQRLPEKYRVPFLLCCLEHKSATEAARQLGVKEGTVWSRLNRAREQLQQRLTKRGVALSAVLAATALSGNGAQASVTSLLVDTTVRAASAYAAGQAVADAVSASVAALVKGATNIMTLGKAKIATALLLAAGLLAGGSTLLTQPTQAAKSTERTQREVVKPPAPDAPLPADPDDMKEPLEVSGKVLGPDGKPFAGAKVYVSAGEARNNPLKTDDAGRFQITVPPRDLVSRSNKLLGQVTIAATAEGYGLDWAIRGTREPATDLTLRLVKDDVPINGRIVTLEGKPVAGAKVRVRKLMKFANENLTAYLKQVEEGRGTNVPEGGSELSGQVRTTEAMPWLPAETTDRDGRFRLTSLGRERVAHLSIAGDGIQHWFLITMTREAKAVVGPPYRRGTAAALYEQLWPTKVHAATFEHLAPPSRLVKGTVRDKETGKPVAGVLVTGLLTKSWTRTDALGHYELHGYPKSEKYGVMAMPDHQDANGLPRQDSLYFRSSVEIPDNPGLDPIVADLELSRGILFQGKLTDKATGRPVPALMAYYPVTANENVRDVPGLANLSESGGYYTDFSNEGAHSIDEAAADGDFRCLVLPGPGAVCVQASNHYQSAYVDPKAFFKDDSNDPIKYGIKGWSFWVKGKGGNSYGHRQEDYQAIALINPDKGTKAITYNIALEPARKVKGIVLGPDGKPLTGARVRSLQKTMSTWEQLGETSEFSMFLPHPEQPRTVFFRHEDRRLVGQLTVTGRDKDLTVLLEPWGRAEGRLITTGEAKPLPGVWVGPSQGIGGPSGPPSTLEIEFITTDKDGRFVLEGLIPGKAYTLRFSDSDPRRGGRNSGGYVVKELTLKAGETKDLGNVVAVYDTIRE